MKRISKMILLSAGILLTLAGCQKGTTPNNLTGKAVRFGVTSGSLSTRTTFTGEGTWDGTSKDEFERKILTAERLSWTDKDEIMVASDNATVFQNSSVKFATYGVKAITDDGFKSYAQLKEKDASEELYFNDSETYKFWGVYPASVDDGSKLVNAQVEFEVSDSQEPGEGDAIKANVGEKTLTTLPTNMAQAVMLAAAENQSSSTDVELEFYPAFTAFEFTLNSLENDIILKELVLSTPEEGKSLAGKVAVSAIKTGGATFASTDNYTVTGRKDVTYTFPENTTITKNDYVTFTVYALPETIKGLTLEFHLGEDGSEVQTAHLKYQGNDFDFAGGKKHCLRGVAVKGGWNFKYLTLNIDVLDWVDVETEISSGDGVQATQFSMSFNDKAEHCLRYVKGNDKNYRQCWVFKPTFTAGEGDDVTTETTVVTVKYKIMMPTSGTWSIEKCGDTASFTVGVTSTSGEVSLEDNTYSGDLTSTGATYITITISSTEPNDVKTLYFKTYVSDGEYIYSLDSETQLYDMRGYHYFIVNGTAATTFDDLNI